MIISFENSFARNCCAARGHALAVWLRLALLSPLRSDPLVGQTRSAPHNIKIFFLANKIILIRFDTLCQTCQELRQLLFLG